MKLLERIRDRLDDTTTLLEWRSKYDYLTIYSHGGNCLTWHAPWCKDCASYAIPLRGLFGWRFAFEMSTDHIYTSGLGFELTYLTIRH